jgi:hypothetical protein
VRSVLGDVALGLLHTLAIMGPLQHLQAAFAHILAPSAVYAFWSWKLQKVRAQYLDYLSTSAMQRTVLQSVLLMMIDN